MNADFIPVTAWEDHYHWPNTSQLRWMIFNDVDGFRSKCVRKVGRRLLVDKSRFDEWVRAHDSEGNTHE